jgi:hypothetical protein
MAEDIKHIKEKFIEGCRQIGGEFKEAGNEFICETKTMKIKTKIEK